LKQEQLDHVLRAAARIIGAPDLLVIGSAAILGSFADALLPAAATRSAEADLAPFDDPDGSLSMAIEGSLGSGSPFHERFGYFADGVDLSTAIVPGGWRDRLVLYETPGSEPGRGWCLERHDLAVSKLVAGRDKDFEYVGALADAGLIDIDVVRTRLIDVPRDRALPAFVAKAERWLREREASR
jgi:hypothetical protein